MPAVARGLLKSVQYKCPFCQPAPSRPRNMFRNQGTFSDKKGTFDPTNTSHVKHTRLGVWDLYEEKEPKLAHVPGAPKLETYMELFEGLPYVWRMLKDILGIHTCAVWLAIYVAAQIGRAVCPALELWYVVPNLRRQEHTIADLESRYQGQLLQIVFLTHSSN